MVNEFMARSMNSWLEKHDIEMNSIHKEGKSVVSERFIKTLKHKIYKYMTSISKTMYIDRSDRTTKMKPVNVKSSTYIDFNKENDKEGPKFKVGDNVRTLMLYQNIFGKGYISNWSEELFAITKLKNTVP